MTNYNVKQMLDLFAIAHDAKFDDPNVPLRLTRLYTHAMKSITEPPLPNPREVETMLFLWT